VERLVDARHFCVVLADKAFGSIPAASTSIKHLRCAVFAKVCEEFERTRIGPWQTRVCACVGCGSTTLLWRSFTEVNLPSMMI
jgi:hypothetical protein